MTAVSESNFIAIVLSIFLAFIAYQNYILSRENRRWQKETLRFKLLSKRYSVFNSFRKLFLEITSIDSLTTKEYTKFLIQTSETEFLFDEEIKDYRDEVRIRCLRIVELNGKLVLQNLTFEERERASEELEKLELWAAIQPDMITKLFRQYLYFHF